MRRLLAVATAVLLASCSEQITLPQQLTITSEELTFARFNSDAFAASQPSASFWAVRGQDRALVLRYSDTGQEYLRFEVGAAALQSEDSVLISVQANAHGKWVFQFEPSGLTFNPDSPALLRFTYDRSDAADLAEPKIVKRDEPLVPWELLQSRRPFAKVVETSVSHFTDFGIATN